MDGLWIFFLGGRGRGRGTPGHDCRDVFADDASSKQPCLCLYYILSSGSFAAVMRKVIANSGPDPRCPGQTRALFGLRQPVDRVHTLKTVKGLLLLVPPRTPRSSGYDVYAHAVYVVICYMSITCICLLYVVICYMSVICYISVICLVLGPSCYMYMSVICCYMLYVCDMLYVCYMSSARGGS